MTQIPANIEIPKPRTRDQAKRLFSNDKIKNFTKLKLQEYIESFFNKTGKNFGLLSAVSPRFIQYNTSKSFDPKTDPTQRRMQIARYFNELRSVIPSILIVDSGIDVLPQSVGLISDVHVERQTWRGYYPIVREIPITVLAAGRDMDEADEISGVISLMFNEMRNLAGGNYIAGKWEEGEKWVIALPNAPVNVGALSEIAVEGDPLEKIWYTEAVLNVIFEDVLAIKKEMPDVAFGGTIVGDSNLLMKLKPLIQVPDTVSLNSQPMVRVLNFQTQYRLILNNSKIATLGYDGKLTPRRFGKVTIQVIDMNQLHQHNKGIISEKEIEIV